MYFKAFTSLKQHAVIVLSLSGVKHKRMHAALPLSLHSVSYGAWDDSNSSVCIDKSPELVERHGAVCQTLVVWWRDPIKHACCGQNRSMKYQGHLIFFSVYFRSQESVSCTSQILRRLYSSWQLLTCPLTNEKTITTFSFFRKNKRWTTFNL